MIKYNASVNKSFCIKTLEDKANANRKSWHVPKNFKEQILPEITKKTGYQGYNRHLDLITIRDFDRNKQVVRSRFFNEDGTVYDKKQTTIGIDRTTPIYSSYLKCFYGPKSSNFVPKLLTSDEIVQTFKDGYAIAPGLFNPDRDPNGSYRSILALEKTQFFFLDGDKWSEIGWAPTSYDELFKEFPDMENDFFYIGESISSRSALKPYLNLRLGVLLPEPIVNSKKKKKDRNDEFFNQVVLFYINKYPFCDESVGGDITRLSYGNARSDAMHKQFDNVMDLNDFKNCKKIANDVVKKEKLEFKKKKKLEARENNTNLGRKIKEERLVRENIIDPTPYDYTKKNPIRLFKYEVDPLQYLLEENLIEAIDDYQFRWHESSSDHSFNAYKNGSIFCVYSSTMKKHFPPNADPNRPISSVRFLIYYLLKYDLDHITAQEKDELNKILADQGYGIYTSHKIIKERNKLIDSIEVI